VLTAVVEQSILLSHKPVLTHDCVNTSKSGVLRGC
jgi:hypothetical protein